MQEAKRSAAQHSGRLCGKDLPSPRLARCLAYTFALMESNANRCARPQTLRCADACLPDRALPRTLGFHTAEAAPA